MGCPDCGGENRPEARFCGDCGRALSPAGSAAATTPAEPAAPASGSPRSESGAERRLVSVLFADLVAFTSYSEGRDPETVRETLTRYFEATREVIERHGGVVEKFIGDAVMAEWGAPRTNEDDAERAVRAALEVVDAVGSLGEGLQARVAVLTGQAAVTLGATDQGMVAGDLVNTAARLQGVAPPDTVLVGAATMQAASGAIAFTEVGEQALKGKTAPVPAWRALRVVGDTRGRGRTDAIEPPFVGRDVELRLLKDLLHSTGKERRPRLVSITGPGGIGKSRLAWEFEKYVDGVVEQVYWHRGRSPSYGEGIAFWALGEMVRRRARLAEHDDEATTREHIHDVVVEFVEADDADWVEQALLALLGLEPPPPGGRDALFAAWRTFFERVAAARTTVLIFEDLQWADGGQLDFIDHLLEWSKGVPLLVVTLARPELLESRPGWGTSARSFNAVGLEPLTDDDMRALLLGLVPDMPDSAVGQVLARADGIPLYAVETVRMLVAEGRLTPNDDGTFRPSGELDELAVPDSLRALVASRLDRLDAADRALIQNATVLGQTFDHRALAHIAGSGEEEVEARLRSLVKRELMEISVDPRSPERGQYGFVQSVIREVAYDTLSRRDRRARHLAAARYFEAEGDDEIAAVLATHYLAALRASEAGPEADALRVQARHALRGAADRALDLGSPDQAVTHLESAIAITDMPAERGPLLARAAEAALVAAATEASVEFSRRAIADFDTTGDQLHVLRASAVLGSTLLDTGRLEEAAALLREAATDAADSPEIHADLLSRLARAHMRTGQVTEAVEAADSALAIAEPLELDRIIAEAMANKSGALAQLQRLREPVALMEAGVKLAAGAGDPDLELRIRLNLGATLSSLDLYRSHRIWQEARELAERLGSRKHVLWITSIVTSSAAEMGEDWDGAIRTVDEALEEPMDPFERNALLGSRLWYQTMRGEDTSATWAEVDGIRSANPEMEDFMSAAYLHGWEPLLAGRVDAAVVAFRESMPHLGQNVIQAHWGLILAGVLQQDASILREARDAIHAEVDPGNAGWGARKAADAGLAALEDRPDEAVAGFREAVRRLTVAGWHFSAAQAQTYALAAFGPAPELEGWEAEARQRFEHLDAGPWLRLLDEVVARAATPQVADPARPEVTIGS